MSENPTAGDMLDGVLGSRLLQTLGAAALVAATGLLALQGDNMSAIYAAAIPAVAWRMGMSFGRRE